MEYAVPPTTLKDHLSATSDSPLPIQPSSTSTPPTTVTGSPILSHLCVGAPTEPTQSDSSPATSESHPPIQPSASVSPLTHSIPTTVTGSPISLSHLCVGAPTEPTQSDSSPAMSESYPPKFGLRKFVPVKFSLFLASLKK